MLFTKRSLRFRSSANGAPQTRLIAAVFAGGMGCALVSVVRIAPLLCLPLLYACSNEILDELDAGLPIDSGATDSGPADSGPADTGPPACRLIGLPTDLRLSEGGRGDVSWTTDGTGTTTLTPPDGFDVVLGADGLSAAVHAPYAIDGSFDLGIHLDCGGATADGTVSIVIRRLSFSAIAAWNPGVTGPDEREHPMLFIDGGNPDRLFIYGGYSFNPRQYTTVNDVWSYDLELETWSLLSAPDAPLRGGGRLYAYPDRAEAVYAGGADVTDTAQLAFDHVVITGTIANWTSIPITPHASAKEIQLGSFIYDAPRDRFLSVCGVTDSEVHCQIGALGSDGRYLVLDPAVGEQPSPRYGFFAAHDEANQRLVIFSGAQQPSRTNPVNPAQDTWALHLDEDPVRWEKLLDADPAVPGRRNGCSAFDPIGKRMFIWGGTPDARTTVPGLYVLDLGSPTASITEVDIALVRPVRSSCSAVYDPARKRILFGFGNSSAGIFADFVALDL